MKTKTILPLLLLFLLINGAVYFVTQQNAKQRVELVLTKNLKTLETHYNILLKTQELDALSLYESTIESDLVLQTISKAFHASKAEKALLRDELSKLLEAKYKRGVRKGVLQYHFLLPDNESFLRMHKPGKFGDDLTDVRYDFKYVNATKQPIRGFAQGRTAHGFRNVFPLFAKDGKHIGAMEVSFSSENFQWYLNNVSNIHTHFLVDKNIFDTKAWSRDDLIIKYSKSSENQNFMIALGSVHNKEKCIIENRLKLEPIKEEIIDKMSKGEAFSSYVKYKDTVSVNSFLPIENMKNEVVAWIVSYEDNKFIELTLRNLLALRIITFIFSLILIYFIVALVRSKELTEKKHMLLDEILDSTDNIMFITDFKNVSFSNNRFKNLLNTNDTDEFNNSTENSVLKIFVKLDGYLHAGLLEEDESMISLIRRTPQDERVVCVLDRHLEEKAFQISVSTVNYGNDFLVTLSDITQMKAKHNIVEKKAYIDGLTGVYNRNKFDEIFSEEILNVKRHNGIFSLALVDIDKFKDFNDKYGHLIGDQVLIAMANNISNHVRDSDIFARWGGEEFVILFKDTSLENASRVCEKLKDAIEKLEHPTAGRITASFGLSEYRDGDTAESLFKRCDDALYLAKENGRNRVAIL